MDDTPLAEGSTPVADAGPTGSLPEGKACVFCRETIDAFADRTSHCTAFLPIAEGRAYSQHYFFLFCCLAFVIGALLPWEGMWWDSNGFRSIHGGFLLLFGGYGIVAFWFNLFHKRMIVWPAMLAALDGVYAGWHRVAQLLDTEAAKAIKWDGDGLGAKKAAFIEFSRLFGPGLWLVVLFSTAFWIVFVISVVQGGRAAGARKEAERAERAARASAKRSS
ncbi:MAG TPA: hypothetical protein VFS92_01110 [Planctomycetota bacterium]|nr:hypothetical protein [Planctomycetota bacterium]